MPMHHELPEKQEQFTQKMNEQPIVSRNIRLGYIASSSAASAVELVTGFITGDIARAVDGLHGSAEIMVGNAQMKDAHTHNHVESSRRKTLYTTLSAFSLAGAGVSIGDMTGLWDYGIKSKALDVIGTSAAGLSFLSATITSAFLIKRAKEKYGHVFQKLKINKDIVPTEKDTLKHVALLDSPTSTIAFFSGTVRLASYGIASQKGLHHFLENTESSLGIVSGVWGAYLFRPTKQNTQHSHN